MVPLLFIIMIEAAYTITSMAGGPLIFVYIVRWSDSSPLIDHGRHILSRLWPPLAARSINERRPRRCGCPWGPSTDGCRLAVAFVLFNLEYSMIYHVSDHRNDTNIRINPIFQFIHWQSTGIELQYSAALLRHQVSVKRVELRKASRNTPWLLLLPWHHSYKASCARPG